MRLSPTLRKAQFLLNLVNKASLRRKKTKWITGPNTQQTSSEKYVFHFSCMFRARRGTLVLFVCNFHGAEQVCLFHGAEHSCYLSLSGLFHARRGTSLYLSCMRETLRLLWLFHGAERSGLLVSRTCFFFRVYFIYMLKSRHPSFKSVFRKKKQVRPMWMLIQRRSQLYVLEECSGIDCTIDWF